MKAAIGLLGLVALVLVGLLVWVLAFRKSPVEKLQPILAKIEAEGTQVPSKYPHRLIASALKYDVIHTDSIISPIIAKVHWYSYERGSNIEGNGPHPGFGDLSATLAYRGDRWEVTSVVNTLPDFFDSPGLGASIEDDWRAAFEKATEAQ